MMETRNKNYSQVEKVFCKLFYDHNREEDVKRIKEIFKLNEESISKGNAYRSNVAMSIKRKAEDLDVSYHGILRQAIEDYASEVIDENYTEDRKQFRHDKNSKIYRLHQYSFAFDGGSMDVIDDQLNNVEHPEEFPFVDKDENKEYFGVETEIDNGQAPSITSSLMKKAFPILYAKKDLSLTQKGLEMNTFPASYKYYADHKAEIKKFLFIADMAGYQGHDAGTCGIHIHINRDGFKDESHIMKMLWVQEKIFDKLLVFSRRQPASYRWFHTFGIRDSDTIRSFYRRANDMQRSASEEDTSYSHPSKYYHFNMFNNGTIEIRLFRGTLNFDTWFACLQLVKTLMDVSRTTDMSWLQDASKEEIWNSIIEHIESSDYEELKRYMQSRRLLVKVSEDSDSLPDDDPVNYDMEVWLERQYGGERN